MLSDGFIERLSITYNSRLYLEQSYPDHNEYLLSLFKLYELMVTNCSKIIIRKPDKRTGKIYKSIAFKTLSFRYMNEYHDIFYKNKIKIVPKNIHELLTARSLAYCIMYDGGKSKYNKIILQTRAFTKNDILLLQNTLKINFKLK
jgi:hypothetical protein